MPAPAIPLILGAAQIATGFVNKGKAKREAKELAASRPDYEVSPYYQENLDLAESELAGGGLSSRAETAYNNLNNQQFASSINAILKGGGSVNNIGEVYGANEQGRQRLALLNDQMRLSHIERLMRAREMKAGEDEKAWQINKFAPWQDKAQAVAGARQGADQQIWSGLQSVGSTAMQWWDQNNQAKMFEKYLNPQSSGTQSDSGFPSIQDRGLLDYNSPDFNPGQRPIPRNQSAYDGIDEAYDFFNDPNFWFRKK